MDIVSVVRRVVSADPSVLRHAYPPGSRAAAVAAAAGVAAARAATLESRQSAASLAAGLRALPIADPTVCPFYQGTVKHSCWQVLQDAGAQGLTGAGIVAETTARGIHDWKSSKTPANTVVASLGQDGIYFVRVAPNTYALRYLVYPEEAKAASAAFRAAEAARAAKEAAEGGGKKGAGDADMEDAAAAPGADADKAQGDGAAAAADGGAGGDAAAAPAEPAPPPPPKPGALHRAAEEAAVNLFLASCETNSGAADVALRLAERLAVCGAAPLSRVAAANLVHLAQGLDASGWAACAAPSARLRALLAELALDIALEPPPQPDDAAAAAGAAPGSRASRQAAAAAAAAEASRLAGTTPAEDRAAQAKKEACLVLAARHLSALSAIDAAPRAASAAPGGPAEEEEALELSARFHWAAARLAAARSTDANPVRMHLARARAALLALPRPVRISGGTVADLTEAAAAAKLQDLSVRAAVASAEELLASGRTKELLDQLAPVLLPALMPEKLEEKKPAEPAQTAAATAETATAAADAGATPAGATPGATPVPAEDAAGAAAPAPHHPALPPLTAAAARRQSPWGAPGSGVSGQDGTDAVELRALRALATAANRLGGPAAAVVEVRAWASVVQRSLPRSGAEVRFVAAAAPPPLFLLLSALQHATHRIMCGCMTDYALLMRNAAGELEAGGRAGRSRPRHPATGWARG